MLNLFQAVFMQAVLFRLHTLIFCFRDIFCPGKWLNRAGSSRNEPDYFRRDIHTYIYIYIRLSRVSQFRFRRKQENSIRDPKKKRIENGLGYCFCAVRNRLIFVRKSESIRTQITFARKVQLWKSMPSSNLKYKHKAGRCHSLALHYSSFAVQFFVMYEVQGRNTNCE